MNYANEFELEGWDYAVKLYFTGEFDAHHPPDLSVLSVRHDDQDIPCQKVTVEETALGIIATTTVEAVLDGWTKRLSFLVPKVTVNIDDRRDVAVHTWMILSREKASMAGSSDVSEQITKYEARSLTGVARVVKQGQRMKP